ncbi:MAG: mannose-1-phosphate guanylyltransferase/mannose-6-phosphate isomerase [Halieaceae bacterium]|jgi:mannose-1-phosphate guanylyltransferase/mannose-6-phosphate isomerase
MSSYRLGNLVAIRYHSVLLEVTTRYCAVADKDFFMLTPVLMAGGVGSRLWPVSREAYPKQYLPLAGEQSMLQDTLDRLHGVEAAAPLIVCNEEHRFIVAEQLRQQGRAAGAIILEPVGRNTAPAVAVAALCALKTDPEATLLVLSADHVIQNVAAFQQAIEIALPLAAAGKLATFGIVPTSPDTGYGYIRRGEELDDSVYSIDRFVEKPDATTATAYVDSGEYFWNSGMFLLRADVYLRELEQHAPAIADASRKALAAAQDDLEFVRLDAESFAASPSDSIDYAVMEHTQAGIVVGLDCGWSDVGAWSALWEVGDKDEQDNVLTGDVMASDCKGSYIRSGSRLVAVAGVENLVVVETADAVLVANKDRVEEVKHIVTQLKAAGRTEAFAHRRVYRPWGSYETLIFSERFQVKRIIVTPGHKLSLQKHHHRAEHWVVVHGTAEVTCEDRVFTLGEDQSTYIPLGHKHRLANPGVIPLELIEVQSGTYLGEDDIVRYEDVYGRSNENGDA